MSSRQAHLDATAGREVVYCHDCRHEWYRDEEQSLACPQCGCEFTEIVSPENDPRDIAPSPPSDIGSSGFRRPHAYGESDSDPGEDDIEDHITSGPGFFMRRSVFPDPSRRRDQREPTDPSDGAAVMRRFTEILFNDLGMPPFPGQDAAGVRSPTGGHPAIIQRTTIREGPLGFTGGSATFTITTGPFRAGGPAGGDFSTIFDNLMNSTPPPHPNTNDPTRPPGQDQGSPPPGAFGLTLQQFLASLLNPTGVHGDAVYTQEALDRIITQLMEANPQSHAAPPATEAAIQKLEKKRLDDTMVGPEGKAECTICIDEMKKGDEVTVLPCKHWFHGECVVLWLKEHNTCPICRAPIEESNGNNGRTNPAAGSASPPGPTPPELSSASASRPRERFPRSQQENADRLNTIRNLGGLRNLSTQSSQRRNSLSPPSPRTYSAEESNSRARVRSPSSSRDRDPPTSPYGSDQQRSSGRRGNSDDRSRGSQDNNTSHGPLSWLRQQFSRDSGNGSGSGRRRS